jgi:hypothetical protein
MDREAIGFSHQAVCGVAQNAITERKTAIAMAHEDVCIHQAAHAHVGVQLRFYDCAFLFG